MTKQEKIQEAYGEHWDNVKYFVYENGWCSTRKNIDFENIRQSFEIEYKRFTTYHWRPISLKGIENNNGWIKIESEADLPKEKKYLFLIDKKGGFEEKPFEFNPNIKESIRYIMLFSSHYQPIINQLPPVY